MDAAMRVRGEFARQLVAAMGRKGARAVIRARQRYDALHPRYRRASALHAAYRRKTKGRTQ
jgi:hypothetical protein